MSTSKMLKSSLALGCEVAHSDLSRYIGLVHFTIRTSLL